MNKVQIKLQYSKFGCYSVESYLRFQQAKHLKMSNTCKLQFKEIKGWQREDWKKNSRNPQL